MSLRIPDKEVAERFLEAGEGLLNSKARDLARVLELVSTAEQERVLSYNVWSKNETLREALLVPKV